MLLEASRVNNLKARVKAECERRASVGSVASYAGTDYDYTLTPAPGVLVKQEHRDKIAIPLNAINADTVSNIAIGKTLIQDADITNMEGFITVLEKREKTDNSGSDCKSSCTGMCYGCTGTCTGSCSGGCSTTCTGSCSGNCGSNCWDACKGCGDACWARCTSSCDTRCDYTCWQIGRAHV